MKQELLPLIIVIVLLAVVYLSMQILNKRTKERMKKRKFGWRKRD